MSNEPRTRRSPCRPALLIHMGLAMLLAGPALAQSFPSPGSWAGIVEAQGDELAIRLEFQEGGNARFSVPQFDWYDLPAKVERSAERTRLRLEIYSDHGVLDLATEGMERQGSWSGWGVEGLASFRQTQQPSPFVREPVRFVNEGREFTGTLLRPRGQGPFPAVVWTHGSGPVSQEDPVYRSLAVWFAERGVASLLYDKRPPHPGADMQMLAWDAVAAAKVLQQHEALIPQRIGVGGMSQGGWVSAIAAACSDVIGFVVGLSAPAISPGEQNLYNQRNKVLNAGFSEEAAQESCRVLESIYDYLRTGKDREEAWQQLEAIRQQPWYQAAYELPIWHRQGLPPAPWEHLVALDFDPSKEWTRVAAPVVCLWGEKDAVVPAELSRRRIDEWLDQAGNEQRLLVVLPEANHDLRVAPRDPWTLGEIPIEAEAALRFVRSLADTPSPPPPTRRGQDRWQRHGTSIAAPYRWLETPGKERDIWTHAQNERTTLSLADDPAFPVLHERIVELNEYQRASVPRVAKGRWFRKVTPPGELYGEIRVQTDADRANDREAELLIDPYQFPGGLEAPLAIGDPIPSPDGTHLLLPASSASMGPCIRVFRVTSSPSEASENKSNPSPSDPGKQPSASNLKAHDLASETIPIPYWPWRIAWLRDSSGFAYVDGSSVRIHRLGTPPTKDATVFRSRQETPPELAVQTSREGQFLFITAFHPEGDRTTVTSYDISGKALGAERFLEPAGSYQVLGLREGQLYVYTTLDAPNGRVIAVPQDHPEEEHWTEIVPEQAEAVYDNNHPARPTVGLFGDRIALLYGVAGRVVLRSHRLDGTLVHEIDHGSQGFTESGLIGNPEHPVVRYDVQSMFDPGTAYQTDLRSGTTTALGFAEVPFDPEDFVLERHTYSSHDGAEIPVYLGSRKGLVRDGSHPTLVHNWAARGMLVRPLYLPELHAWIEEGGVVAVPAVRGSGEHGEAWSRAGTGLHKINAIDDFGAAAEWLVRSGYSRTDRIGLLGASMGGAATAGTLVRHRNSFGACVIQIPRVDLMAERAWVEEYGNPEMPDEFAAMCEWLPLRNASPGFYPATMVQVGSDDRVAPPAHGYKLVATLQHAQRANRPIYLQVIWGAGHSQGSGIPKRSETLALQFTFLARHLGLSISK